MVKWRRQTQCQQGISVIRIESILIWRKCHRGGDAELSMQLSRSWPGERRHSRLMGQKAQDFSEFATFWEALFSNSVM